MKWIKLELAQPKLDVPVFVLRSNPPGRRPFIDMAVWTWKSEAINEVEGFYDIENDFTYFPDLGWAASPRGRLFDDVIAWQYLPEPPKPDEL